MLRIEIRDLAHGSLPVVGGLAVDDPIFADVEFALSDTVQVGGRLTAASPGRYYWRGRIETTVRGECRRCLAAVRTPVDTEVDALFTEDQDADDPSEYVIPVGATAIDLGPAVREELILAVGEYALCRDDCRGLCPRCGVDLNTGTCTCPPATDPRWAALEALKARPAD